MWDPSSEIERMHEEIDQMYRQVFNRGWQQLEGPSRLQVRNRVPLAEVTQTEKSLKARIELPGVDKNNIQLHVGKDAIEVKVESKQQSEVKKKGNYQYAATSQQFYRRLPLPTAVDASQATAEYKDGVLHIDIPKLMLEDKQKRIEVK